jgi:hypothetical protein
MYDNISKTLLRSNGAVSIENRLNIGLKFGPDIRASCVSEADAAYRTVLENSAALEENLLKAMKDFDQEKSTAGRKAKAGPGLERFKEPWWIRDVIFFAFQIYFLLLLTFFFFPLSKA